MFRMYDVFRICDDTEEIDIIEELEQVILDEGYVDWLGSNHHTMTR